MAGVLPLVSVIMGVKCGDGDVPELERAAESILRQSMHEIELVICTRECGSSAMDFLSGLEAGDPRVILLDGGACNHLGGQLNLCLKRSRGSYIARMDHDDYSYPERLRKESGYLDTHPGTAFVGSQVRIMRDGAPDGERRLPLRPVVHDFMVRQPFIHPALMFRRECLEAAGGYSDAESRRGCEDYDLLLRLYGLGYAGENMPETLLDYSMPPKGKSRISFKTRRNETVTRFENFKKLGLLPGAFPYVLKPIAVGLLPSGVLDRIKGI